LNNLDHKVDARNTQLTLDAGRNKFRDEVKTAAEYSAALHNRLIKLLEDSRTMSADEMSQQLEACHLIAQELTARIDTQIARTLIIKART
jgi:hydroxypyruvate isomerase